MVPAHEKDPLSVLMCSVLQLASRFGIDMVSCTGLIYGRLMIVAKKTVDGVKSVGKYGCFAVKEIAE